MQFWYDLIQMTKNNRESIGNFLRQTFYDLAHRKNKQERVIFIAARCIMNVIKILYISLRSQFYFYFRTEKDRKMVIQRKISSLSYPFPPRDLAKLHVLFFLCR